jgi:hypothetical protein
LLKEKLIVDGFDEMIENLVDNTMLEFETIVGDETIDV